MTTAKMKKKTWSKFWSPLKRVLSSAKLHTFEFFMEKNQSLINILNEKGPKIYSCCTPLSISHQELNDEPIFVLSTSKVPVA